MKRTPFRLLALLLIFSLIVTACGPEPVPTNTPEPTEAAPEPTKEEATSEPSTAEVQEGPMLEGTVTLWHGWKENEIESLYEVIAVFQARNPGVQVQVSYMPLDDLRDEYETAAGVGGGPSILIGAADWGPALFDAQLVSDIQDLADTPLLDSINQAALGAVTYKDALIGLPQTIKGVVMFRNTDIIAEAPATFDELVAAAQAATQDDVSGAILERGLFFSAAHLNGVGGLLMDEEGDPLFNDEKGVEWLELLNSFSDAGPTANYTDNDIDLFKAGQAGIIIDATWNAASLAEGIGAHKLAIDPWPSPMSGYVQTENIYLNANVEGDDRDASFAFMEFFLSSEAQALLADVTRAGHIPAVSGVEIGDPLIAQAAEALAGGVPFRVIPEMGVYWRPLEASLQSVFDEGANPAAALSQAYNSIIAAVAEIRGEAPPEQASTGVITLWHTWEENEIESLSEVIAAFQSRNPDVQFEVLHVPPDDLRDKYEAAATAGGGPSILFGAADWGPDLFDAGLVVDVRGLTTTSFVDSINQAALGVVKYKGALVGLPHTIMGVVMFRNTDIIAEAPATYDGLVAAAQAATQGDILGAVLERGFAFSAAHLDGIGGQLMDSNGDPMFNDEKGVEWLTLLNSFSDAGPVEYYADNDVNLFKAGKVGIVIDSTWNTLDLAEAIGADKLAIDPWPAFGEDGHLSGYVQTENVYLSANAEGTARATAWAFMEFLLSPEAQALLAEPGKADHIPAIIGVEVSDPHMAQIMEALTLGMPFPVRPEMGAYWGPMDAALGSVFDEGLDPGAALQTAYDTIVAVIEEMRSGQ